MIIILLFIIIINLYIFKLTLYFTFFESLKKKLLLAHNLAWSVQSMVSRG
jgi:hypothetical protein